MAFDKCAFNGKTERNKTMDNQIFYKILSGNNELENTTNEIDINKNNINQPLNKQEPSQEQIKQIYLKLQKMHHSLNNINNTLNDITRETNNSYSNKNLIDIFQRIKRGKYARRRVYVAG